MSPLCPQKPDSYRGVALSVQQTGLLVDRQPALRPLPVAPPLDDVIDAVLEGTKLQALRERQRAVECRDVFGDGAPERELVSEALRAHFLGLTTEMDVPV